MEKSYLAQQLRERQYRYGLLPKELVDMLNDDDVIESYVICPCCDEKIVTKSELANAIELATDCEHFFSICDIYSQLRNHLN